MRSIGRNSGHFLVVGAVALALLAGGCSSINDRRGYIVSPALVDAIQPGIDNRLSVSQTLGRPTFTSQYGTQTWYYVSSQTGQKPFTAPSIIGHSVLKVEFDASGNVTSTDRTGMDLVAKINPDGTETPTLGRERGFLEDLFGNIGSVGGLPGQGAPAP
ncbi:outer membrane protein assembly factor BamE [Altererythrobacter aquiaggeris]|uniref:outer membrane protein assembly factor BamE n=1 Tax=Aestuarierythrobacter aquiaggeris TaxID=1898396 RepID=UPI00301ADBD2